MKMKCDVMNNASLIKPHFTKDKTRPEPRQHLQNPAESADYCEAIWCFPNRTSDRLVLSLSVGGRGLNRWAEGERTREERKQGACSCSIFKVCIIRLVLTRGPGLMKLFLLFSLTLCSRLPECLSLSLSPSLLSVPPLPFVFICPFHICSLLFHL